MVDQIRDTEKISITKTQALKAQNMFIADNFEVPMPQVGRQFARPKYVK